jgi:hypothetical protein
MRKLAFAIAITTSATASATAYGDTGIYAEESLGGGSYRGELARYGDGAARLRFGAGIRRGEWATELYGSFMAPDFFYIDCYSEECAYAAMPKADVISVGLDVRKRWRLLSLQRWGKPGVYERPGVFMALHGGPRWITGDDAIRGYGGPGIGGGAAIEGDLWVIGYFVDFGLDVFRLEGPGETLHGSTPYVMFGGKIGWL